MPTKDDAPERIWADFDSQVFFIDYGRSEIGCIPYVRADVLAALQAEVARLTGERDEARRRRDEWRKKAEGYEDVRLALRDALAGKFGDNEPRSLSRIMWAGIAADWKARAEAAEGAGRDAVLPDVDSQVISAARDLSEAGKANPVWAFIDYEAGEMSFGRWAKCGPNPAPYIRLDLILALLPTPPVADAARDVLAERQRQINAEGWTPEHDDEHSDGQMAGAAACYALQNVAHWAAGAAINTFWPWDPSWWKPTDRRRDLIKAGALILAEIERLDRRALTQPQEARDE